MNKPTFPCDAERLRGQQTRLLAVEIVRDYRERKRAGNRPVGSPRTISGRSEVTPPLLTDDERGQSDSTNSRLHRIIGKYRDFALVLNRDRE